MKIIEGKIEGSFPHFSLCMACKHTVACNDIKCTSRVHNYDKKIKYIVIYLHYDLSEEHHSLSS